MVLFSLAFEGDKKINEYINLALLAEKLGFYSIQIYEHLPFKPAWGIVFSLALKTERIKLGPVTVPVFLYHPLQLARYSLLLAEITKGRALLGISRGAYYELLDKKVERSIKKVIETIEYIEKIFKHDLPWALNRSIELYVGTSGPILAEKASSIKLVKGIIVDMLWNPNYARKLKNIIEKSVRLSKKEEKVNLIARPFTYISENPENAKKEMLKIVKKYIKDLVGPSPMLEEAGIKYEEILNEKNEEKIISNLTATGKIEDILEQTAKIIEAGVDHVCYGHPLGSNPSEVIKLINSKIIPYFNS